MDRTPEDGQDPIMIWIERQNLPGRPVQRQDREPRTNGVKSLSLHGLHLQGRAGPRVTRAEWQDLRGRHQWRLTRNQWLGYSDRTYKDGPWSTMTEVEYQDLQGRDLQGHVGTKKDRYTVRSVKIKPGIISKQWQLRFGKFFIIKKIDISYINFEGTCKNDHNCQL
jgi:hypothetical protein